MEVETIKIGEILRKIADENATETVTLGGLLIIKEKEKIMLLKDHQLLYVGFGTPIKRESFYQPCDKVLKELQRVLTAETTGGIDIDLIDTLKKYAKEILEKKTAYLNLVNTLDMIAKSLQDLNVGTIEILGDGKVKKVRINAGDIRIFTDEHDEWGVKPDKCTLHQVIEAANLVKKELPQILENPQVVTQAQKLSKELLELFDTLDSSIGKTLTMLSNSERTRNLQEKIKKLGELLGQTPIEVGPTKVYITQSEITAGWQKIYNGYLIKPSEETNRIIKGLPEGAKKIVETTEETIKAMTNALEELESKIDELRRAVKRASKRILEITGTELYEGDYVIIEDQGNLIHVLADTFHYNEFIRTIDHKHIKFDIITIEVERASIRELELAGKALADELHELERGFKKKYIKSEKDIIELLNKSRIFLDPKNPKKKLTFNMLTNDGVQEVLAVAGMAKGKFPRIVIKMKSSSKVLKPLHIEYSRTFPYYYKVTMTEGVNIFLHETLLNEYKKTKEYQKLKILGA